MVEAGEIRHPKKAAFLAAVSLTANITRAADLSGISRDSHYEWKKQDPEYAKAFESAWDRGIDALEAEAVRRACEGVEEPVFSGGKRAVDQVDGKEVPATIRKYSDTLLIFLLNGNRSKKYRQRIDSRFTDENGRDRPALDLASVRAYMQAANDDGSLPGEAAA